MMQTLSSYCYGDGLKANAELNYEGNVRGEELKKKVMMAAAVLCLGLLLGAGSRMASSSGKTGMYVIPGPFEGPYGRSWADFVISAGTNWGDFPSPVEEEEEKILNELTVFCNGHKEKLNEMSEYFVNAVEDISDYQDEERLPDIEELAGVFTVVYLKADQEKLMSFFSASYFWTTQKIDKYLFVVMEKPEHWY